MNWYTIRAAAAAAELFIYDAIESTEGFVREIAALPSSIRTITVRINSPGGDPFSATAIANALRNERLHKGRRIEVAIEGLAASAATLPPMAGDDARERHGRRR